MGRDLVVRNVTPATWEMVQAIAPTMHRARLFGVASPEQAAAILLKGYELGLGFGASFEFIQVIQGKPTLSPRGALALILRSELLDGMKIDEQADRCTVWMKRKGGLEYSLAVTLDDAKKAGLVKAGSAWQYYPSNMLRWRAVGFVADVLFSDVLGGLKRADEFGADLDENGDVVEGQWAAVSQSPAEAPQATPVVTLPTPSGVTLDELVERYGAEAVIVANEGKIPGTDNELAVVAERLAGA